MVQIRNNVTITKLHFLFPQWHLQCLEHQGCWSSVPRWQTLPKERLTSCQILPTDSDDPWPIGGGLPTALTPPTAAVSAGGVSDRESANPLTLWILSAPPGSSLTRRIDRFCQTANSKKIFEVQESIDRLRYDETNKQNLKQHIIWMDSNTTIIQIYVVQNKCPNFN